MNLSRCLSLLLFLTISATAQAAIWRVAPGVRSLVSYNGTTFSNAANLHRALALAQPGDEIWLLEGVYYPDEGDGATNGNTLSTYLLPDGISLYGGFDGTETSRSEADPSTHITVLSGDLYQDDPADANGIIQDAASGPFTGDHASRLITVSTTTRSATVDGLVFTATSGGSVTAAAAVYWASTLSPTGSELVKLQRCQFIGNFTLNHPAVLASNAGSLDIVDCAFLRNYATSLNASSASVTSLNSQAFTLRNCLFEGNQMVPAPFYGYAGGAASVSGASGPCEVRNVTFRGNDGNCTIGFVGTDDLLIRNCLFRSNLNVNTGAIYTSDCNAVFRDVEIRGSSAGGIYLVSPGNVQLFNTLISGNAGTGLTISAGTAISVTVTNCTLTANDTDDAPFPLPIEISGTSSQLTLQNTIVWGNNVEYSATNNATTTVSNCLLDGSPGITSTPSPFVIPLDYRSAPSAGGNFHPAPGSAALQAGDSAADLDGIGPGTLTIADIGSDLDGDPRIIGSSIDIGAYEGLPNPATLPPIPVDPLPFVQLFEEQTHPAVLNLAEMFDSSAGSFAFVSAEPAGAITGNVNATTGNVNIQTLPGDAGEVLLTFSAANANGTTTILVEAFISGILRVAPNADPGNTLTGQTWANATNLRRALTLATEGDRIWLRHGRYYPDVGEGAAVPDSPSYTFTISKSLALMGGFAGTETLESAADPAQNLTILSGDVAQDDTTDAQGRTLTADNIVGQNANRVLTAYNGTLLSRRLTLDGLTVTGGRAEHQSFNYSNNNGGGLWVTKSTVQITRCAFLGNRSNGTGGAIYCSAVDENVTLTDTTLRGNQGPVAIAVVGPTAATAANNQLTMIDCEIRDTIGAGASITLPSFFQRCLFQNNHATSGSSAGGGLSIQRASTLDRCRFIGNSVLYQGGGLHAVNFSLFPYPLQITHCLFTGNAATATNPAVTLFGGGAVFLNDSSYIDAQFTHCTLAGNSAFTAGAVRTGTATTFTNCILANNDATSATATPLEDTLVLTNSAQPEFARCLVAGTGGSTNWNPAAGTDLGGNGDEDPIFFNPQLPSAAPTTAGNYHIAPYSPAIDRGLVAAVNLVGLTDLDGAPRQIGPAPDLGVFEVQVPTDPSADDDADGMINGFELAHTTPLSPTSLKPLQDIDFDGMNNLLEFFHGSNPELANASPRQFSFDPQTRIVTLSFPRSQDATALTAELDYSTDLGIVDTWDPLPISPSITPLPGNRDLLTYTVTVPNGIHAAFFRPAITLPAP